MSYSLPVASVTNYHKFRGLKHRNLFSYFLKVLQSSEVSLRELNAGCLQGWVLLEAGGENPFPCLFQLPEAVLIPWLTATSPPFLPLLPSSRGCLLSSTFLPPLT